MNTGFLKLQAYPFERLQQLLSDTMPSHRYPLINLTIGEPKHNPPKFVLDTIKANLGDVAEYPKTGGITDLKEAIADWLTSRYCLPSDSVNPTSNVLPVNGTREALFAFAQCFVQQNTGSLVLSPNPFYQIYEGAALLSGAEPWFYNLAEDNGFLPDFSEVPADVWRRARIIYICSPGNPTGAVIPMSDLQALIRLADEYDFIIAADECYSELYFDEQNPPPGLLQACAAMNRTGYERCVVFHSLSKRSNLPGLRSGFVAGDADLMAQFLKYRTYHGCAMAHYIQKASVVAWRDESHAVANRALYRTKFDQVLDILQPDVPVIKPEASFYLWLKTPVNDEVFAKELFRATHVKVLPGSYLSRSAHGLNPGENYVRIALVDNVEACQEAARRIHQFYLSQV